MKTKKQIKEWILKNCINDEGIIELTYLDFNEFNIHLTGIKAKNIYNSFQEAKVICNNDQITKVIFNNNQKAAEEIYNNNQKAKVIYNNRQEAKEEIDNHDQKAKVICNNAQITIKPKYKCKCGFEYDSAGNKKI